MLTTGSGEREMKTIIKILKGICISALVFVLGLVAVDQFVAMSASRYIDLNEAPDVEVILVLGASITPQKEPSLMLAERLDAAIEIYKEGHSDKIIVSGDHDSIYYNEVGVMKAYLVENGIPEQDIFMDHAGFSTYESMVRAKEIFGVESLIISTQSYHLKRAVYIARALDMEGYGVTADDGFNPYVLKYRYREFLARIKDFVYVHVVRPEPTHLGDPISIQSDGRITEEMWPIIGVSTVDSDE